jgi:hypothetical protein
MKIRELNVGEAAKNILTFMLGGVLFFIIAPLQADPHHDGVILAPAIAFSENLPLHSGAFSQYGPLSPLVSGFWLKLTEPNLISLRYLAALQALVLSFGLFLVLRQLVSLKSARLITMLWIFASGIWATRFPGALMAWPSLLSTLFLVFALLCSIKGVRGAGTRSSHYLAMAGFLIAIAGFARAQSWAIAGAIGLTLIFTPAKSLKKLAYLCLGYALGFSLMLGYLFSDGAIEQWWLQSIYWPTQIYPALGQGNNYNRFQAILYIIEGISLLLLIFIASQICKRYSVRYATIFIAIATIISLMVGFYIPTIDNLPIRYRVLFGEPCERILVSPYYLSVLIAIWISYKQLRKTQTDRNPTHFLVATFGVTSVIQLYPQSDVMHLWWIAPVLLPSFAIFVSDLKVTSKLLPIVFERTTLVFSIFGVALGLNFTLSDWTEFRNPALAGTYASADKVNGLLVYNDIVENAIPKKSSFDCYDGIYSVLSGEYLSVDEWYVSWGFPKTVTPELGEIRFICGKSHEYAVSEALRLGWILTEFKQSKSNPEASLAILKKP